MRLKFLSGLALAAALGAVLLPGSALPVAQIHDHESEGLADYDSRVGKIAPTTLQRTLAKRMKVRVSWSQFGTPASLTRNGKVLAKGIRARTAADAATWYLNRHKALFGLGSIDQLALQSANRLAGSNGYAVNFKQVFGRLQAAEGGLVTVGVSGTRKSGWRVAYVSSALTRDRALAGSVKLSAAQAWVSAARNVGLTRSIVDVLSRKHARGWIQLGVSGLVAQNARLVAFPTIRSGVVPAYETIVLDVKASLGQRVYVDARNGRVLARTNIVDNASSGKSLKLMVTTHTFAGEVPAADAACGPDHTFAIPAGNRALDGFAAATIPTNDVVLFLLKDGVVLVEADTLFSPEQFHYEPAGGVAAGNYVIRVCDFPGGGGFAAPRTYTGTLTEDDSPAPPPYLARWKVFPGNPPLHVLPADPWNNPSTDTRETWCWVSDPGGGCDRVLHNLASRGPWDHDHKLNTPTLTTRGNNAKSATSWTDPFLPSPPQFMPVSPTRDYSYTWTNDWFTRDCEPTPGAPGATWDDSAATANLFAMHNRMHDWSYFLGFTERNFNAQDYNFGLTERRQENDPILGDVQAGAISVPPQRDNANMITLPDGLASVTNMYFWQPLAGSFYAPCVDGDYDMPIIGHEYGHMIENRMIGKGTGRSGHHAGAMGESFGDMNAMEYVNEYGFLPTSDENRYTVGAYATGNKLRAIRNYSMGFPMSGGVPMPSQQLNINALNFSDMGYDVTGPQVHADGEIWSATNFRIRTLLNDKYDDDFPSSDADLQESCADGVLPAQNCPGNRRWIQLYYDAMLLMPGVAPSMLQARDGILAADLMRFGGANQKELWLGFARSGFGKNAVSSNTTANTDIDPTPDFEPVGTTPRTVRFRARSKDGDSIAARIYVGHYEGRVSPIADTNPATDGANLDDVAAFAPGTYEFVANAPGYGHVRFRETFRSGGSETINIKFPTNWASMSSGATASGDGTGHANLIDDTEANQWTAEGTITGGNLSVDGKQVTIDLGGTDPIRVRYIQVSAHLSAGPPAQNRFTALRQFELWACNGAAGSNCTTDAGFTKVYTSPANAFPGDPPRPVAPHLILRKFDTPNFRATHVRFVVKSSQCTGTPAFQGNQDADPLNDADCDSNVAANASRRFVRAAELQVFRHSPGIDD